MSFFPQPEAAAPDADRPFVVEHVLPAPDAPGPFVPDARLLVRSTLRTSGLLAYLPDAEARSLLLLLTFLSPNGHLHASLPEIAEGLRVSQDKARRRMLRLTETPWRGEPLALSRKTDSGLERFSLSPSLVEEHSAALPSAPVPVYEAVGRETVLAHSRKTYAVPRSEAERMVAAQLGHEADEAGEGEVAVARRELAALGVPRETIAALLREYPLTLIQQQIRWLPLRHAKSPARFIVAAIQGRYLPPVQARFQPASQDNQEISPPDLQADEMTLAIPTTAGGEGEGTHA